MPETYHVKVQGASFQRPNNTTAYTAGDAVGATAGTVTSFAGCGKPGGSGPGKVVGVQLSKSKKGVTNGTFRVFLYTVAPTAIADNSPFETVWADRAKRIGHVDLTLTEEGGTNDCPEAFAPVNIPYVTAASSTSLYAVLAVEGTYTPVAQEEFQIALSCEVYI